MTLKFIATTELGRLSKWLRILGYDVAYETSNQKAKISLKSLREDRIILTRNLHFFKPTSHKVLFVKSTNYKDQLKQVIKDLNLKINKDNMFIRCVMCNEYLREIAKDRVKDKVPPYVFKTHNDFMQCKECQRIYWSGTHWLNVDKILEDHKIKKTTLKNKGKT